MAELLVIIACYVAAALLVQWAARRRKREPVRRVMVALGRHALQAEDVIRRLRRWSRWSGKSLRIAVTLDRSDGDAARIVELMARRDPDLVWGYGDFWHGDLWNGDWRSGDSRSGDRRSGDRRDGERWSGGLRRDERQHGD